MQEIYNGPIHVVTIVISIAVVSIGQVIERRKRPGSLEERNPLGATRMLPSRRHKSVRRHRHAQRIVRDEVVDLLWPAGTLLFLLQRLLFRARDGVADQNGMQFVALNEVESFPYGGTHHCAGRVLVGNEMKRTIGNDSQCSVRRKEPRVPPGGQLLVVVGRRRRRRGF